MLFLALSAAPAKAAGIVSLNLCADQLLLQLAPERIAALSPLARDPSISALAAQAQHFPRIADDAEAVLALHPELVLAGEYGAQNVLALLEAHGVRVMRLGLPRDFSGIAAQVTELAGILDARQRGAALVAAMQARLAALPRPAAPLRALYLEPRLYSAAPGGWEASVLAAAGLRSIGSGARYGLEEVLAAHPDVLVVPTPPAMPSRADAALAHPALAGIPRRFYAPADMICAGPQSAEAAVAIAAP